MKRSIQLSVSKENRELLERAKKEYPMVPISRLLFEALKRMLDGKENVKGE